MASSVKLAVWEWIKSGKTVASGTVAFCERYLVHRGVPRDFLSIALQEDMVLVRLFWRQVPTAYSPVLVSDDNSRHLSAPLMTANLVSIFTLPLHTLIHSLHTHALASHSPPHIQCVFCFPWLSNDYCCFKIVVWCYYERNKMLI